MQDTNEAVTTATVQIAAFTQLDMSPDNKPGVIIYDMRSAVVVCSITNINPSTNYLETFNIYNGMQLAIKATGNGYNYKVVSEFGETIVNKII